MSLRELELGAAGVVEIVSALILANAHGRQVVPSLLALLVLVQKVQILTREEALRAPPHELLALIQALRSMAFDCAKFTCFTSTKVRILTREEALRGRRCWRLCRRCCTSTSTKVQILTREELLALSQALLALMQALRNMAFDCASNRLRVLSLLALLVQKYKY